NEEYEIGLNRALEDIYGNRLDKDYRYVFEKGDYTPHVEIPTGINIIEAQGDLRFPITAVNVDSVYMEVSSIDVDKVVPFLTKSDLFYHSKKYVPRYPYSYHMRRYFHANAFTRYRNEQVRIPFELKEVLDNTRRGLLFLQLDHLGQTRYNPDYRYLKAFIEVSDIGVTWKYSPENNLIWVTSLSDARPLSGVRVHIRNNDNRILWQGVTNDGGFCDSPGWAELGLLHGTETYEYEDEYETYDYQFYDEPDLWLTLAQANDAAVYSNQWHFGIDPWRFNISYNWYVQPEEYAAYIFTEKGLYRSGEKVHVKGIVRKKSRGQWITPDANHVQFMVRNARGEEIRLDTIRLNRFASFYQEIPLNADAPTGVYSIDIRILGKPYTFHETFRVEAYRPAEFEVKVSAERDTFLADGNFTGSIKGRYLFGMPMKDARVTWNLRRSYHYLSFPQHEGYQFGEYIEGRERALLGSGSGKLDAQGEYEVSTRLSIDDIYAPSQLHLEGIVTAPNMTAIAGEQNWLALSADYLIGIKREKFLYVLGDTVDLRIIAVTPSGSLTKGKNIKLEVFRVEWKSIKKARLGGRYEWVSEKVETRVDQHKIKSNSSASNLPVVPEAPGYYYVRAHGQDNKRRLTATRIYFYVAGHGFAGWEMRDDDMIELIADQDEYRVGDTARILVKSPYDSARCLVTVERELVMDKSVQLLRGNADYVKIPIKSQYLPNVYVCVTLLRGRVEDLGWSEESEQDMGKPQFKIGYVSLKVNTEQKRLKLIAKPDKADYRPRDSVFIELDVKDHQDRPVANTEVALFVVDLGVLNLIDFHTPDPFQYFYGSRPLSVRTIESRVNILGERNYGEKGEDRGGGGAFAEGVSYREKFVATAFYEATLHTDSKGKAAARFKLPDNLTKFRIMAVAHTRESQFGSVDSTLVVNLPFMMTPSIPRFARVGDAFKAGVVLHNSTDNKEKASVECRVEGLESLDRDVKQIMLPPNTSKEVLFRFRAQHEGEAVFEFKSHMGEETDAVRLVIPVSLPPLSEGVATFSSTQDSAVEALVVPSQIHEDIGGVEVMLSPTVLAGMDHGIEFLLDYPYYCLEQTMSKILPLIVGEDLINEFDLASVTGQVLRDTVQAVVDAAHDYQQEEGGFTYFRESRYPCPYLSAYVMYVLHHAQAAGYSVDRRTIDRGIGFLR
ncbi:MAG: alpha-2-macroglobulin family protein, partial [candidate division WOR-3 bacterium]